MYNCICNRINTVLYVKNKKLYGDWLFAIILLIVKKHDIVKFDISLGIL